jgi:hypothetical protein
MKILQLGIQPFPDDPLGRDLGKIDLSKGRCSDLIEDPGEAHNLVSDPAFATVFKDLTAELETWQKDHPPVPSIAGLNPQPPGKPGKGIVKASRKKKK